MRLVLVGMAWLLSWQLLATPLNFDQYRKVVKSDPQVLIDLIKSLPPERNSLTVAETALLLSSAYYGLSQAPLALEHAESALANSQLAQQEPLRYQQLLLARAMAYDIAGTPAKGLEDIQRVLVLAE